MKYTVTVGLEEQTFSTVDNLNTSSECQWSVNEKSIRRAHVDIQPSNIVISEDSEKAGFLYRRASSNEVEIATHLGSMKFKVHRGEMKDLASGAKKNRNELKSSIPGKVIKVFCKPGDEVEAGSSLLILEAMKMENEIRAAFKATIEAVVVSEGQKVESGELLVRFKPNN